MNRRSFIAASLALVVAITPEAALAAAPIKPLVQVIGITVNNVVATAEGLVANATMTLKVGHKKITQDVQIPLTLAGSPGAAGACDILNLSLGPIHLDVLGLVVDLDNCAGGAVTIDITGNDNELLGSLLCDIAGLLSGGLDLGGLLDLLDLNGTLGDLTGALTGVLNGVFQDFFKDATATAGTGHAGGVCDILHLSLAPIHLDVLGLVVDTSAICVDITAEQGPDNLLGNLLCGIVDLLDTGGTQRALQRLLGDLADLLNSLGL